MAEERLQKILAAAGISSRRGAEEHITTGRVRVNGKVVHELGAKANPKRDRIEVDGQAIVRERPVYVVLNKPKEVMSTLKDPEGRPTVVDLVRVSGARVTPVGRLDFHTSGVLLLTNDGEFSAKLQHPRHGVPKRYSVKVQGEMDERSLSHWRESIMIDGRATIPAEVTRVRTEDGKTWLNIVLKEGRNRHIRQLAEHAGSRIMRLVRFEYAGITAEGLRAGQWRHLTIDELKALKAAHGVPARVAAPMADDEAPHAVHSLPFRNHNKRRSTKDESPPREREAARERRPAAAGGRESSRVGGRENSRTSAREVTRGGRTVDARGGRTADARGGRTADARGGRTADARGGRTADARGGRTAENSRTGGRMSDARGSREVTRGDRTSDGRAGGRENVRGGRKVEARSGGRTVDARGGGRQNSRTPARAVDARGGRMADSQGRAAPERERPLSRAGAREAVRRGRG